MNHDNEPTNAFKNLLTDKKRLFSRFRHAGRAQPTQIPIELNHKDRGQEDGKRIGNRLYPRNTVQTEYPWQKQHCRNEEQTLTADAEKTALRSFSHCQKHRHCDLLEAEEPS